MREYDPFRERTDLGIVGALFALLLLPFYYLYKGLRWLITRKR